MAKEKRPPGRPAKTYMGARLDSMVCFRLPSFVMERLDEAREEYGQNRSEFVRNMVIQYFRQMTLPVIRDTRLGPRLEE